MRKEISAEEAKGCVLRDIVFQPDGGRALLVFNGGVFTTLAAYCDHDGDVAITESDLGDPTDFGDDELIRARIATRAELDAIRQAKRTREHETSVQQERMTYERLSRKYGDQKGGSDDQG